MCESCLRSGESSCSSALSSLESVKSSQGSGGGAARSRESDSSARGSYLSSEEQGRGSYLSSEVEEQGSEPPPLPPPHEYMRMGVGGPPAHQSYVRLASGGQRIYRGRVRASLPIGTAHKPYQTLEVGEQSGERAVGWYRGREGEYLIACPRADDEEGRGALPGGPHHRAPPTGVSGTSLPSCATLYPCTMV